MWLLCALAPSTIKAGGGLLSLFSYAHVWVNTIMQRYLLATDFFDFKDDAIVQFSERFVDDAMGDTEKAVALYNGVRDGIRYNPYVFEGKAYTLSASHCLKEGQSYCIPKAVLLGALCRLNGIPARLGLADVKNHLSSPALIEWLKSDVFVMHGYIELHLEGKWVKATPAFDAKLCERMDVKVLDFNGTDDSIFHEFNGEGARHMEYINEYGEFDDVPFEFIVKNVAAAYPHLVDYVPKKQVGSLEADFD